MVTCIGGIFEFPWIALSFLVANWKTGVAAVWGLGFAYILFRSMRRWYKEDAQTAQILCGRDADAIYDQMKVVARDHRSARLRFILTEGLFWCPLLAYRAGRKVASIVFYPILVVMDRAQKDAIDEARRSKLAPYVVIEDEAKAKESHMEEPRCAKCGMMGVHTCVPQLVPTPVAPTKEPIVECPRCGVFMKIDCQHSCEKKSSSCPDCGEPIVVDTVHNCPSREGEDDSDGTVYCRHCDLRYDPAEESHPVEDCSDCGKKHCTEMSC